MDERTHAASSNDFFHRSGRYPQRDSWQDAAHVVVDGQPFTEIARCCRCGVFAVSAGQLPRAATESGCSGMRQDMVAGGRSRDILLRWSHGNTPVAGQESLGRRHASAVKPPRNFAARASAWAAGAVDSRRIVNSMSGNPARSAIACRMRQCRNRRGTRRHLPYCARSDGPQIQTVTRQTSPRHVDERKILDEELGFLELLSA